MRAAAFSALRAGMQPWCVDLFADADLAARCPARRLEGRYPGGFAEALAEGPPGPWIYTGGLENHPRLVDRMACGRALWGNGGDVLRRARDPKVLANAARSAGLPAPALGLSLARGRWLVKPRGGAGGAGIRFWQGEATRIGAREYVQEFIDGPSASAVFVGVAGEAVLLGMTRQLVGEAWLDAPAFRYCGSVGPLRVECEQEIQALGNILVERTGMRGLFGVDGVLRDGGFWPVEVNPRYTASVEVLERATGVRALGWHRAAFEGYFGRAGGVSPPRDIDLGGLTPPARPSTVGKAILFARREVALPLEHAAHRPAANQGVFADLPHPGERIAAGRPILTLFAEGADIETCLAELRARAADVEASLYAD